MTQTARDTTAFSRAARYNFFVFASVTDAGEFEQTIPTISAIASILWEISTPLDCFRLPNELRAKHLFRPSDEIRGYFKIGRSNSIGRREYELFVQMPEKLTTIRVIKTDDPARIEAYWHKRFA